MKNINKAAAAIVLGVATFFAKAGTALATPAPTIGLQAPTQFQNLGSITYASIITGAIRLVLIVAALVFFFILVIGGIQWITSGGDKAGTEAARKRIMNALIGLAIVFAAWAIISLINVLFGVNILDFAVPSFLPGNAPAN